MAALRSRCGQYILPCGFYLLFSFLAYFSGRRLDVYHSSTHGVALVRIKNAGLKCAALGSLKMQDPKKVAKNCHLGTIAQICRAISSELRHISTLGKNLLNSNTSSTCPDNMVNFGLLTAEICWRVWGHPCKCQPVLRLGTLLHGTFYICSFYYFYDVIILKHWKVA